MGAGSGARGQVFHVPPGSAVDGTSSCVVRPLLRALEMLCQLGRSRSTGGSKAVAEGYRRSIARAPRIEIEDGVYHVVARGNERRAIYRHTDDRQCFLDILGLVADRYGWQILAYCLMTNHYHLLVQTPNANLARGMQHLNSVYAQSFNRRHGRDGHLFQGRYGSILVQADEHVVSAVRYILRNPLRAGLCERVDEWPWSSHQATMGTRAPGFLAADSLLSYFHELRSTARTMYLALAEDEGDEAPPSHPSIHGTDDFIALRIERLAPSPDYPRVHLRLPRPPLDDLLTTSADSASIAVAHREHGYSMREIANHLDCGLTTIHRRIRAHETKEREAPTRSGGTWKT